MDLKFVEALVDVLEGSRVLSEIEYSDGQRQVLLKRHSSISRTTAEVLEKSDTQLAPMSSEAAVGEIHPAGAANDHCVFAGMTGTFYRSPAPSQPTFVSVGDIVEEGQTLAIVEAMKLLNPIEADRAGRVSKILADDGAAVFSETPLFVIEDVEQADV